MDYDSLTSAQRKAYHETVEGTHHRRVELVLIRRSDSKPVGSLTNEFLGGSIQGDVKRSPETVLECDVLDVEGLLNWSHGDHRAYSVRIIDHRFVPALNDWVEAATFTGPLWDFERSGAVASLVAEGSEMNALGSVRSPKTWPAKTRAVRVMREQLLAAGARPRDISIPKSVKATLPRAVTVGVRRGKKDAQRKNRGPKRRVFRSTQEETYWGEAEPIADAIGRDLFADGWGRFLLRRPMKRSVLTLTHRTLLAEPTARRAHEGEITNVWIVLGKDPKGPKKRVRARVTLPRRHPASAWSTRWNGTPREVIETIDNPNLRTKRQAVALGKRRRDRMLRELVEYQSEALPVIPWLRGGSLVTVPTPGGGKTATRVRAWSLPLGPGPDAMTLGMTSARRWRR